MSRFVSQQRRPVLHRRQSTELSSVEQSIPHKRNIDAVMEKIKESVQSKQRLLIVENMPTDVFGLKIFFSKNFNVVYLGERK